MKKKTVAVFFGGKSTEHDVSIVTALSSVIKPLEVAGEYEVIAVYIAKNGAWYLDEKLKDISLYSSGEIIKSLEKMEPLSIVFGKGLILQKKGKFGTKTSIKIDVAFPAMHGTYGEDGSLMGLLRMSGVPFVGCDLESSVIAMNKLLAHQVLSGAGVESHNYIGISKDEFENDRTVSLAKTANLQYPLFVKPVHLGSSIGISKVDAANSLAEALEVAFSYDTVAIVEEAVQNLIEVTVPVMGQTDNPIVALVERPLIGADTVFDFETKYLSGGKKGSKKVSGKMKGSQGYSELPAKLDGDLYSKAVALAKTAYRTIGCSGIARVDLLIDGVAEKVYFNEINPLPGGLYDHNWRAAGVSSVELVTKLIGFAEKRAEEQQAISTTFSTNFLQQF